MKDKKMMIVFLILIVALGIIIGVLYIKNNNILPVDKVNTPFNSLIKYNNKDYGFIFSLPLDWEGYSVIENTWQGNLVNTTAPETGPKLLIRNPNWTETLPYEDIPIMIFTLKQWDSYIAEDFSVGAAPILASELARNNTYVFAFPARWNFDYSKGFEQAENILKSNPIEVFNLNIISYLKDGRQCYTYNHEGTTIEPYTVNEFIDITIADSVVKGTKNGTQNGPDMTNGYSGIITGTVDNDTINSIFSYTIEGSKGKEKEIYKIREDLVGIEKLRYPLIEKNGMLVPDITKEFKTLLYARVGCTA